MSYDLTEAPFLTSECLPDLIFSYVRNALMLQLTECEYMNVVFDMHGSIRKDTTYTYTWQCVQLINAFHTILGSTVQLEWMPD
jgi:hypothetical protein